MGDDSFMWMRWARTGRSTAAWWWTTRPKWSVCNMPTQTKPDNATPAATRGADATTETASNLAVLMGFQQLATETSSGAAQAADEPNSQPEAGPVKADLSQLETASDGAEGEAEGEPLRDESPAAEADSDADASAEEEQPKDDADKTDEEVIEGLPRRARKRIDKLTAQKKALEAELAQLRAKPPEAKATESAPVILPPTNPLHQIVDLRELEAVEAKSRDTVRAAERALDALDALREDLDADPDAVVRQLKAAKYEPPEDREGLVKFIRDLKQNIRGQKEQASEALEAVPKRRSHLEHEARVMELAAEDYPWLKTKTGEEYQLFEQVVKSRPLVKQMGPDWPFVVAVQIEGLKALQARRAAKAKAAPVMTKPAPPKTPSRSAPPRVAAGSAARSRFEQTGRTEDLAALMPA